MITNLSVILKFTAVTSQTETSYPRSAMSCRYAFMVAELVFLAIVDVFSPSYVTPVFSVSWLFSSVF